jgi:hypothetical protein
MSVYRIETTFTGLTGAPYYNRLHFLDSGGPDETFAVAAQNAVYTFWQATAEVLSNNLTVQVQPEIVSLVENSGQPEAVYIQQRSPVQGTNTEEELPFTSQLLVQFRTGVYVEGRERRGRMYLPGLTELDNENGRPTGAIQSGIANDATALAEHNPPLCVYTPAKGAAVVSGVSVWNQWAILRSRRD